MVKKILEKRTGEGTLRLTATPRPSFQGPGHVHAGSGGQVRVSGTKDWPHLLLAAMGCLLLGRSPTRATLGSIASSPTSLPLLILAALSVLLNVSSLPLWT